MEHVSIDLWPANLEPVVPDLATWLTGLEAKAAQAARRGAHMLVLPEFACAQWLGFAPIDLPVEITLGWLFECGEIALDAIAAISVRHGVSIIAGTIPFAAGLVDGLPTYLQHKPSKNTVPNKQIDADKTTWARQFRMRNRLSKQAFDELAQRLSPHRTGYWLLLYLLSVPVRWTRLWRRQPVPLPSQPHFRKDNRKRNSKPLRVQQAAGRRDRELGGAPVNDIEKGSRGSPPSERHVVGGALPRPRYV